MGGCVSRPMDVQQYRVLAHTLTSVNATAADFFRPPPPFPRSQRPQRATGDHPGPPAQLSTRKRSCVSITGLATAARHHTAAQRAGSPIAQPRPTAGVHDFR